MKKKKFIIIIIITVFCLFIISFFFFNSKKDTSISIKNSDITLQGDVLINLIQTDKVTNLITFNKNELNTNEYEKKDTDINVNSDGKIILQVKINDIQYESIIVPYTTNGNSISSINLQIINKNNAFFVIGNYDTILEGNQKINSKLEKVVAHEKEL